MFEPQRTFTIEVPINYQIHMLQSFHDQAFILHTPDCPMNESKQFCELLHFIHLIYLTKQNFDEFIGGTWFGKRVD